LLTTTAGFFLLIAKFFCFMTNVIGREECSTARWIDACKIDEAGKIAHNFFVLTFVTATGFMATENLFS
jgi:hypothetical protein